MGSDSWTPSEALPWGPYSIPRPPAGKGNDPLHVGTTSLKTQQTFGGGGLRGGHMKFSQIEGGSTIFMLLPGGDKKFNRVFHPVSTTPPVS